MRWRLLVAALIVSILAVVGVTMWQLVSTPLPVPHVRIVKVPVPGPAPVVTNRYYTVPGPMVPASPAAPVVTTTTRSPVTTTTAPTPSRQTPAPSPRPAPSGICVSGVPVTGTTCLP